MIPKTFVITAGSTHEHIDDVRYITNHATGALPAAMAEFLLSSGHDVIYIHGPRAVTPTKSDVAPGILTLDPIVSAADMLEAVRGHCLNFQPYCVICAAAVADFAPVKVAGKIASRKGAADGHAAEPDDDGSITIKMFPTAKVIEVVKGNSPNTNLLGFKFLAGCTEDELVDAGKHLMQRTMADACFCNSYSQRSGTLLLREIRYTGVRGWEDPLKVKQVPLVEDGSTYNLARLILQNWLHPRDLV